MTENSSADRSELTFGVSNWPKTLSFDEHMSAPVIADHDLMVFLVPGCERRLSLDRSVLSYSGLSWTTNPDVRRAEVAPAQSGFLRREPSNGN
jgi:hypothetical protein